MSCNIVIGITCAVQVTTSDPQKSSIDGRAEDEDEEEEEKVR